MRTVTTALSGSALVMALAASSAVAELETRHLRGDFAFSGTGVCASSQAIITPTSYTPPRGFDANLVALGEPFSVITFSVHGVRTFNGDGTGSVAARVVALSVGDRASASSSDQEIQFTYSVAPDGTVTTDQSPTHNVFVSGGRTGQQTRISNIPAVVGRLSADRNSITFATFNTGIETVTRVLPDGSELVEALRICHRERTAFRISRNPGGERDD
jgi:hypothetical protein